MYSMAPRKRDQNDGRGCFWIDKACGLLYENQVESEQSLKNIEKKWQLFKLYKKIREFRVFCFWILATKKCYKGICTRLGLCLRAFESFERSILTFLLLLLLIIMYQKRSK